MSDRSSAIVISRGRVLLMYRSKHGRDYYVIPGGGIDTGETPEQTVIRELKEEAGLDIKLDSKFFEHYCNDRYVHYYLVYEFYGRLMLGGEERIIHRDSLVDNYYRLEWVPFHKIDHINLFPCTIQEKILTDIVGQLKLI